MFLYRNAGKRDKTIHESIAHSSRFVPSFFVLARCPGVPAIHSN